MVRNDVEEGWKQIISVDEDIAKTFHCLARDTALIDQAVQTVSRTIEERKKIFIYGCGSTGRLAKMMESALWRPFWDKLKKSVFWDRLRTELPDDIEDRLIGEMTGGDRALISALEGFEDLQIVGRLQLQERGVENGDMVVCITEGGETSSVIGAILAACGQYGHLTEDKIDAANKHLYFIYNNPDDVLKPFDRSRAVIENPAITKINLTTGPQAVAGSTRMQATTADTFLMGIILEFGIRALLEDYLSDEELAQIGFTMIDMSERLRSFDRIRERLAPASTEMAEFIRLESETYQQGNLAVYFASRALLTVFVDCAERSPTFHLHPLDMAEEKRRKCWLQVWTEGGDYKQAWHNFLGREFRGLDESFYRPYFSSKIDDVYLKEAALNSLALSGGEQEKLYDFSFNKENMRKRGPKEDDLAVLVCLDEEIEELCAEGSAFHRFAVLCKKENARLAFILVSDKNSREIEHIISRLPLKKRDLAIHIFMEKKGDPLNLDRQLLLKILLNSHSTAVMARLGRVVGNTMTNVIPSNLKLIGRATYLIMSHVNDVLSKKKWIQEYGKMDPVTYEQANAILFEAMDFVTKRNDQISEVELSIIRVLEALRTNMFISWEDALSILMDLGLENYLENLNPSLRGYM